MRISYYLQKLAFTTGTLTPLLFVIAGWQEQVFYVAAYAWLVGIAAFFWGRVMRDRSR